MGQKDLAQNDYFNDKVRFADVCNGVLFHGNAIIKSEELQETGADIVYQEEAGKRRKVIPDKVWKWKGIHIAILTVENQTKIDYSMVFRVMKEEAVSYERQWKERECEYKRRGLLPKKAHLCWKGKGEKFTPVITVVIYYGIDKEWDGAVCLYDLLNVEVELQPYVTNYKMNLFDYHDCDDFSIFKTENRELFEMLSCAGDKDKMGKLISDNHERYSGLSEETVKTICDIAGINSKWIKTIKSEGMEVVVDMCKAWDDRKEEGKEEGNCAAVRMCKNMKLSVQDAVEQIAMAFVLTKEISEQKVNLYWE